MYHIDLRHALGCLVVFLLLVGHVDVIAPLDILAGMPVLYSGTCEEHGESTLAGLDMYKGQLLALLVRLDDTVSVLIPGEVILTPPLGSGKNGNLILIDSPEKQGKKCRKESTRQLT